jgi:hypothetical protein
MIVGAGTTLGVARGSSPHPSRRIVPEKSARHTPCERPGKVARPDGRSNLPDLCFEDWKAGDDWLPRGPSREIARGGGGTVGQCRRTPHRLMGCPWGARSPGLGGVPGTAKVRLWARVLGFLTWRRVRSRCVGVEVRIAARLDAGVAAGNHLGVLVGLLRCCGHRAPSSIMSVRYHVPLSPATHTDNTGRRHASHGAGLGSEAALLSVA